MAIGADRSVRAASRRSFSLAALRALALAPLVGGLPSCGQSNARRVVAYVSADDVLAREVLAACSRSTGVEVDAVFDTEAAKTIGLENRIRAERDRPRADLFWSSEGFSVVRLAAAGLLRPMPEELWRSWPERHRDPDRMWLGFSARARVVVARADAPEIVQWSDLARPGLQRGSRTSVAIADPRFGTTAGHVSALSASWSDARSRGIAGVPSLEEWLDGLVANGVAVLPGGNAATVDAVASGECAYGMTDTDDALAAIERGLRLRMDVPRTLPAGAAGGGTMVVPNTVALIASGPSDPRDAEAVARFLVSEECEGIIARSPSRNLPLGSGRTADLPYSEPDPLVFDLARACAAAPELAAEARRRLMGDDPKADRA